MHARQPLWGYVRHKCCHGACRAVLYMQSRYRMVRCRRVFLRHRRAAVAIQAAARGAAARRRYAQMVREHQAATVIQARQRGHVARADYRRSRDAVVAIQMAHRRWKVLPTAYSGALAVMRLCLPDCIHPGVHVACHMHTADPEAKLSFPAWARPPARMVNKCLAVVRSLPNPAP